MFDTSKDVFWIILSASIGLVSILLSVVLFRVAKIIQESEKTVKNVNRKLKKLDPIIDDGVPIVSSFLETLEGINNHILKPVLGIGSAIRGISGLSSLFRKKKNKKDKIS